MNRHLLLIAGFSILFLFFIQVAGTLVEAIYILDLLKTSLDARVLGVLFFFSPVFLLPFKRQAPRWFIWLAFVLLIIGRGAAPYLNTSSRMLAAGIGTGAALLLIPLLMAQVKKIVDKDPLLVPAQGLALGVGLSILLRTLNYTIDISLTASGGWIGWFLAALLGLSLAQLPAKSEPETAVSEKGLTSASVGCVAVLNLMYFAFTSPGVIARWTEGNYPLIVVWVSLFTLLWLFISLSRPELLGRIKPAWLVVWNLLFSLALTGTILAHTVRFPPGPGSPAVEVTAPAWYQQIPLVFMLLLFPVLLIDFAVFTGVIVRACPAPRRLAPGFLLGAFFLVASIFMHIFTNVWAYVEPVSPFFRNKFWLPYLLLSGGITLLILFRRGDLDLSKDTRAVRTALVWSGVFLTAILLFTAISAFLTDGNVPPAAVKTSLKVMTYNIQQANDASGEKSLEQQLALIRQVDPDILGLQESDSARISLNNNDIVRYFASQLGFHVYYGPKTVTGTYGTALLSKYPLENPLTFFTYSDQDEIGTVQADIVVGDQRLTVFNVHPDGSDQAMMVFAEALLQRAASQARVISIGDYNLRSNEAPYQLINKNYKNAWIDVYPAGISTDGIDMSGENRIDHIFVSPQLHVSDPVYLLPPDSHTDHPAHWATISW